MKALSSLLLVSLGIGVAAPAAARPSVAALPGVSDVLLNLNVAAPAPAGPRILDAASWRLNADRAVGLRATSLWPCSDFNLVRVFAGHGWFDDPNDEVNTKLGAPGVIVFHKTAVEVGDGCDTMYITIAGVGEITAGLTTTNGFQDGEMQLGCFVDDSPCFNPPDAAPDEDDLGFVGVFSDVMGWALDDIDYGATIPVNYTWCLPITPGTHDVRLNLASGEPDLDVSLSKVWVYVDASHSEGGCVGEFSDGLSLAAPRPAAPPAAPAVKPPVTPTLPPLPKLP